MKLKKYDTDLLSAVESTNKKLLPLFRRAVERGESDLEIMLAENAMLHGDAGSADYHCMVPDQYVKGRNHHGAAKGKARSSDFQFFGNALVVDEEGSGDLSLDEARSMLFRGCNSYDRLPTLIDMAEQMDCSDWLSLLGEVWTGCDNITQFHEALLTETPFAQLVENPARWRHCMMTADERVALEGLRPSVTIYRGCFQHNKEGLCWSMDRRVAAGFPFLNRYRSKGKPFLITATVAQEQVLALKNERDESEVIAWRPDIQDISLLEST